MGLLSGTYVSFAFGPLQTNPVVGTPWSVGKKENDSDLICRGCASSQTMPKKGLFLFKTEDGAKRFCFPQSVLIADDPQRVRTLEQPKIMDKGRESIEMVRMPVGKD
jgi:hypothetical protein